MDENRLKNSTFIGKGRATLRLDPILAEKEVVKELLSLSVPLLDAKGNPAGVATVSLKVSKGACRYGLYYTA